MSLKYFIYDWGGYNKSISQCIHSSFSSDFLIIFSKFITQIGNFYFLPLHFTLVVFLFFIILRRDKKNVMNKGVIYIRCLCLLLFNIFVGVVVFKTMKHFFGYPRPYCTIDFSIKQYLLYIFKFAKESCNSSFPSGHTAYVCLFIMSFWSILTRHLKLLSGLVMFLVGLSRIILAKHFIADVTFSYLIVLAVINPVNNVILNRYFYLYQPLAKKLFKKIVIYIKIKSS